MDKPAETDLQQTYQWVDEFPLTRPKRDIKRDFADAINMSEIISYSFPRLIDCHNYSPSNSYAQKTYNWKTLNQKVFRRMDFQLTTDEIEHVVTCKKWAIENILIKCKHYFQLYREKIDRKKQNQLKKKQMKTASHSLQEEEIANFQQNKEAISEDMRELLVEKDRVIQHLTDKVEILELKVDKLNQLLNLKNSKIDSLQAQLRSFETI